MSTRYLAIDFETANSHPDSACAVGWALIDDGSVKQTGYSLIDPQTYVSNTPYHGLTAFDMQNAPLFPEIWQGLTPLLQGSVLLAHNIPFDACVLFKSLLRYGIELPTLTGACTVQFARKAGVPVPNRKLSTLCDYYGIELKHHHAGSDAKACAQLMLRIAGEYGCEPTQKLRQNRYLAEPNCELLPKIHTHDKHHYWG
jgi:DNA polymerase-3 subunit epsilon